MTCPECSAELDPSGACGSCGYRNPGDPQETAPPPAAEPDVAAPRGGVGPIQVDYSDAASQPAADDDGVPEWKKELSRRLQEIKQRRQQSGTSGDTSAAAIAAPEAAPPQADEGGRSRPTQEKAPVRPQRRSPARVPKPAVPAAEVPPPEKLPLFEPRAKTDGPADAPAPDIGTVIDRIVERHHSGSPASGDSARPVQAPPVAADTGPRIVVSYGAASAEEEQREERMTLLSRTLSGLVDLIVVLGCTVGIIVCTDVVAGVALLDQWSAVVYGTLLLAVYFLYSVYFLGTGTQTLGMMITGLRLVDEDSARPALRQVLGRSAAYLLAVAPLGLGLAWGCFDRRARCWQDRLSGTRVARL